MKNKTNFIHLRTELHFDQLNCSFFLIYMVPVVHEYSDERRRINNSALIGHINVDLVIHYALCSGVNVSQGDRTKFDKFVDPNIRGAQLRVYSDLRIYRN